MEGERHMSTIIRPEIRMGSKWYISKHRYYELKHFCLQYYDWKFYYENTVSEIGRAVLAERVIGGDYNDPTFEVASRIAIFSEHMRIVEESSTDADPDIGEYIFRAVTEDLSFTGLKMKYLIPCEKNMYYDRYRKFFWILDKRRL